MKINFGLLSNKIASRMCLGFTRSMNYFMRLLPLALIMVMAANLEADKARYPIFCQGTHTCFNERTQRFTCPVYGYYRNKEEAMDFMIQDDCCVEYNNSYSIGFNFINCGWGAPRI